MKVFLSVCITLVMLLCASFVSAGVVASKHDFAISGSGYFAGTFNGDNDETCVYCHTPHSALGSQTPLWNRNLSFPNGFTVYSNSTMDSTPSNPPSTISLLCLSCHDGVTAINSVINSPGPGSPGMAATGFDQIGDLGSLGKFINIGNGDPDAPAAVDLSDDHPVSITWADRGPDFYATPQDTALELFNDETIECNTCHDPHNGTPFVSGGVEFMTMSNAGSAMCLACHIK